MDDSTTAAPVNAPNCGSSTERRRGLWPAVAISAAFSAALAGCASGDKLSTIPSDGPTMAEIYRAHMAGSGQLGAPAHPESGWRIRDVGTAASIDAPAEIAELQQRFARLPNPDLVMYVTPHLSPNGRYPVPGYRTVFPLYETVEYALPGEVAWRRPAVSASVSTR